MHKRKIDIIFVLIIAILFWIISFPLNEWFSETMPRHQIMQLPAMLVIGIITGAWFAKRVRLDMSWGITVFIFIMFSLMFWMLPHSVDMSVINPSFNRLMHLNIFIAGFFFVPGLRGMILELRILFLGMIAAMTIATGYALMVYDILLCSAFDVVQQRETGVRLLIIGLALFAFAIFTFFRNIGRVKPGQ